MLDTRERNDKGRTVELQYDSTLADEVVQSKSTHRAPADSSNSVSSPSAAFALNDAALPTSSSSPSPNHRAGRWTPDEKILFLYGLKRFGKGRWKKMSIYLPHRYVKTC
jgi:hypothetical protein